MYRNTWIFAEDVEDYARTALSFLSREPAANTVQLTVFDRLRVHGPHAFGPHDPQLALWYDADGEPAAAVLRTPPFGFLATVMPAAAADAFAELMLAPDTGLDGREINLPDSAADGFATAWTARTGKLPQVRQRQRLYRLDRLVPPDPAPPGRAKRATVQDVPFIAAMVSDFWLEVEWVRPEGTHVNPESVARARVDEGAFWLWLDESGRPVSLAGHTPITAGTARIGPVHTPKELRGRGYASAATSAATSALLAAGADEVLLFTDLANPTSNALYQRIGYRPVSDRRLLDLED